MRAYKGIEGNYYEKAQFESHKSQMFFYESREEYLLELLSLGKKSKVLEIGCGSGILSRKIHERFDCVMTGCDISEAAVKHAGKLKNPKLNFKVADINKLPFKNASFDAVVVSHVIEHVKSPQKALGEASRVLKKNGKLLIATPNYFSPWPIAELVFDKTMAKKGYSLEEQHISKFNPWSLKSELEKSGLKVETMRTVYFASLPASLFSTILAKALFRIEKLLSRCQLSMIIYAVAVKK